MIRRRHLLASLLALLLLLPASPALALSPAKLGATLAQQMRHAGSASSAYVQAVDGDKVLYSLRPDRALIPASINKLFVTATSLRRHGPDDTLDTVVLTGGEIDADGVLHGNLFLRGSGDPTLSSARIAELADQLQLTKVEGAVVGDESRFDALRGSTNTGGLLDGEIGGELGALVSGRGYAGRSWQRRPAAVAADALRAALERRDIPVTGKSRIGTAPDDAVELARTSSAPMADLIARTNVPSDNFYAEMLLKDLGASYGGAGTTRAGAEVVQQTMAELGIKPTIVDGSGLSRGDRTSTRMVVHLLDAMAAGDEGDTFVHSLALVGKTGTVAKRMRGTPAAGHCHTKTGTLRDVSNLAGVCETAGGQRVAFAFLMNGVNPYSARAIQDRMAAAVARLS